MDVRLDADVPNALAALLAERLEASLVEEPRRARLARGGRISLRAADVGLSATVQMEPGGVIVRNGGYKRAEVRLRADTASLLELADAPKVLGVPDPFRRSGRAVIAAILSRRVDIRGALRHPLLLLRFSRLLGAA